MVVVTASDAKNINFEANKAILAKIYADGNIARKSYL